MLKSRRKFLKESSLAISGATLLPNWLPHLLKNNERITGLQLYSVRDDMKVAPLDTLRKVAGIGYKYVEHAGYSNRKFYGYPVTDFRKILDDLGLRMISGHTVLGPKHWDDAKKDFTDEWKNTVDDAAKAGQKFVISPWLDESLRKDYDGLLKWLDLFNKSGELCKKYGMKFGYHNHNFEFNSEINNQKIYDIILEHTDPTLVAQQMDIGNMYGAGGRAIEIIRKYPGRFELMHVKDEIKSNVKGEMDDGYESTVLGKGILGVKEIIDVANRDGGTSYFIIEQESYQTLTPIESVGIDFKAMKDWGY